MITNFEEYRLNEELGFSWLKNAVINTVDHLNFYQKKKLKNELEPYRELTKEEIEKKIRMELDPYSEENWDGDDPESFTWDGQTIPGRNPLFITRSEREAELKRKIKKTIIYITPRISVGGILAMALFGMTNIIYRIIHDKIPETLLTIELTNLIITIVSSAIFFLCWQTWKNKL